MKNMWPKERRACGQFYTNHNPFDYAPFKRWAKKSDILNACILEPFAGSNSLVAHLTGMGLCHHFQSFDIHPTHHHVSYRDTLADFPSGYHVCITNPPWLARNSATARGLSYPSTLYDDLYKFSLEKCLDNCPYVAALVPESFIRASLFLDRLSCFISITQPIFSDTKHPVGLALFLPEKIQNIAVFSGSNYIGTLVDIKKHRPIVNHRLDISFNEPKGNLGLIALDNTKEASIRFCDITELKDYQVKKHGRHITKLNVSQKKICIKAYNNLINRFREATGDVLMTSYRGLRKDGKYRRRLDWNLARAIIEKA